MENGSSGGPDRGDDKPATSGSGGNSLSSPSLTQLAQIAHELRTPLSAIAIAADVMRGERFGPVGDDRYREYAAGIHDNARHALSVLDRMLGRSGAQASGPSLLPSGGSPGAERFDGESVFTEVDIGGLCHGVAGSLGMLAQSAELDLHLDVGAGLPRVVADETALRQILINLLTNAIRATPPGGRIAVAANWSPPGPLTMVVVDSGCGIDEALAEHVMAGSAPPLSGRFRDGEGIGLPLVMRLAALNGAAVDIGREPSGGTRVAISFPAARLVI